LSSSKSPEAYDQVVYAKGPWVIHMIREMLRQPNVSNSRDSDARFIGLLQTLQKKYAHAPLSTEQFQREVEAVMTPRMALEGGRSMEWFFEQYVRGTGIPHYKVEYTSRRTEKGFVIRGKLTQTEVPRSFVASVPLYTSTATGRAVLLGSVLASGEETSFTFTSTSQPRKLLIDPHMTLLCVPQ
jgi:aminopeptidase N